MAGLLHWAANASETRQNTRAGNFASLFQTFQRILDLNNRILETMADMGDKLGGDYVFDRQYIHTACRRIAGLVYELIYNLNALTPKKYPKLDDSFRVINHSLKKNWPGAGLFPTRSMSYPMR